jgi:hypothetical protein
MRVVKGILCMLVAGIIGGALLGDSILDIAMLFLDFTWSLVGWAYAVAGVTSGAIAGYVYFGVADPGTKSV